MPTTRKKFLQQTALALAGIHLPFSKLFAEKRTILESPKALDTYHPKDCSFNLATSTNKYNYIDPSDPNSSNSDIAILDGYYSAGGTSINPYNNDVLYKSKGDLPYDKAVCDVDPATNECNTYDYDPLSASHVGQNPFRYKAYYPKPTIHDYRSKALPVYILFHAGGFQECPNYDGGDLKKLIIELSEKGFICFTVEYRRGRIFDISDTVNPKVSVQQQFARYRAIQDGCGAIRSIIKKNRTGDAQKFPFVIDETQVFVGGQSAGGFIALGCAYYQTKNNLTDQSMLDMTFPKAASSPYNIQQTLGKMHQANFYYAEVDQTYWPKFAGVASMWGGFIIPKSFDGASNETDYAAVEAQFFGLVDAQANPPLIAFHGASDPVVPYNDNATQDIDLSPLIVGANPSYNTESFCTINNHTFSQFTDPDPNIVELKSCSSFNLHLVMRQLNKFSELYVDCSMKHGLESRCCM